MFFVYKTVDIDILRILTQQNNGFPERIDVVKFPIPSCNERTENNTSKTRSIAMTSTQALVNSICRDVRPYLRIPSSFSDRHIDQLSESIRDSNVNIQHLDAAAGVTASLHSLLVQVTTTLAQLDVDEPSVENMQHIIELIQASSTLKTLSLHHIPHDKMSDLQHALLTNTSVRVLDLSNNEFEESNGNVIQSLATLMRDSTSIECILLNNNHLQDLSWLTRALERNTCLKMLSLADNHIIDLQPLATLLQDNVTLQRLYLHGNKFHHDDIYRKQVSHFLQLNANGRRLLVRNDTVPGGLYALILSRVSTQPSLMYGLIRELPQAWTRPPTTR